MPCSIEASLRRRESFVPADCPDEDPQLPCARKPRGRQKKGRRPRVQAEKEEDARREARRQALARQLEEEAARRDAARQANTLPVSLSNARRVRSWGRIHPKDELLRYAEAWALRIQFNAPVETVREVASRPHTTPNVTEAVRSDAAVESVTFEVSSGVAEIDEAIRRIVEGHRP
jgi:hypothetical protein